MKSIPETSLPAGSIPGGSGPPAPPPVAGLPTAMDPEFDAYAENYDQALQRGLKVSGEGKEFFAEGRIRWLAVRLSALGYPAGGIMDFGCGTGTSTPWLMGLPGATKLIGLDVSARSIEVARRVNSDPRARFELLSQHRPVGDLTLAFCNGVFHHIPEPERPGALRYVYDSLRPGGIFAWFENNPWNPGTRWIMSRIPFDREAVTLSPPDARRRMRAAGFSILHTDFLFFFPRPLAWLRGLELALRGIPLGAQYLVLARKPG